MIVFDLLRSFQIWKRFALPFTMTILLSVFTLIFLIPQRAHCNGEITNIKFVEEANWPPFTPDKFGIETEGLSLTLMQTIFSHLNIGIEIELLPQKRMLEYLKSGQKDGATVISINKDRLEYLEFSEPLFSKRGYIYYSSNRKHPITWDNYSDLQGLTIGIVAGHNYGESFSDAVEKYRLDVTSLSHVKQGFDLLLAKRIDCFLSINLTANHYLKDSKYSKKIVHAPKSYFSKDYHVAFSKKSDARFLVPRVNEVIRKIKDDGSLTEILAPYLD